MPQTAKTAPNLKKPENPRQPIYQKVPADIFIIEPNRVLSDCLTITLKNTNHPLNTHCFSDTLSAIEALDEILPALIFINLTPIGPNAFNFLNELVSYPDTAAIPIILLTTAPITPHSLPEAYHIVKILNPELMHPADIKECLDYV